MKRSYGLGRRGVTPARALYISVALWAQVAEQARLAEIAASDLVRTAMGIYLQRRPSLAEDATAVPAFSVEVRMSDELWARVTARAAEEQVTEAEVIRRAIVAHLKRLTRARGNGHEQHGRHRADDEGGGPAAGGQADHDLAVGAPGLPERDGPAQPFGDLPVRGSDGGGPSRPQLAPLLPAEGGRNSFLTD